MFVLPRFLGPEKYAYWEYLCVCIFLKAERIQISQGFKLQRVNDQDSNKKQKPAVEESVNKLLRKDRPAKEEKRVDKLRDYSEASEYSSDSNNKSYDQGRKV